MALFKPPSFLFVLYMESEPRAPRQVLYPQAMCGPAMSFSTFLVGDRVLLAAQVDLELKAGLELLESSCLCLPSSWDYWPVSPAGLGVVYHRGHQRTVTSFPCSFI